MVLVPVGRTLSERPFSLLIVPGVGGPEKIRVDFLAVPRFVSGNRITFEKEDFEPPPNADLRIFIRRFMSSKRVLGNLPGRKQ